MNKRCRGRPRRDPNGLTRSRSYTLTEPCHEAIEAYAKSHGHGSASEALEKLVALALATRG